MSVKVAQNNPIKNMLNIIIKLGEKMDYHIVINDVIIASFEHEGDRDICLDALADTYPDCVFRTKET